MEVIYRNVNLDAKIENTELFDFINGSGKYYTTLN